MRVNGMCRLTACMAATDACMAAVAEWRPDERAWVKLALGALMKGLCKRRARGTTYTDATYFE